MSLTLMGSIWWGETGDVIFFLFSFFVLRAFKNKSDVSHVLCEELFI